MRENRPRAGAKQDPARVAQQRVDGQLAVESVAERECVAKHGERWREEKAQVESEGSVRLKPKKTTQDC